MSMGDCIEDVNSTIVDQADTPVSTHALIIHLSNNRALSHADLVFLSYRKP